LSSSSRFSEWDLIRWLRRRCRGDGLRVGIGDDAAVLGPDQARCDLITTDLLLEGIHFSPGEDPRRVGRKAMACNLSDIAAMGGTPRVAVVSLGLRRGGGERARELMEGLLEMAERFGVELAGGDTTAWDHPTAVSVTLLGVGHGRGPVLRSGGKPGGVLFVTGMLGGSILGRHLDFEPRVREGIWLAEHLSPQAMIDLSDGLASDLVHLARESRVGAVLEESALPISEEAFRLSRKDGRPPLEHALCDGEDFELLFAVSPEEAGSVPSGVAGTPVHRIGYLTQDPALRIKSASGEMVSLETFRGYTHWL
jgi:thiamine-monophosphate kinase